MNRFTIAALIGVVALAAAPLAIAGAGMRHGPPSPEKMREHAHEMADHIFGDLEVDEAQSTAIHALVDEGVEDMGTIHDAGRQLREATKTALATGDEASLDELEDDVAALADRAARTTFGHLRDLRALLTDAQWSELSDKHERMIHRGPPWMHHGPKGPGHDGPRRPGHDGPPPAE